MFTRQPFSTSAIREAGRLVIRLCGPLTFRGGAADKEWGAQLDSAAGRGNIRSRFAVVTPRST